VRRAAPIVLGLLWRQREYGGWGGGSGAGSGSARSSAAGEALEVTGGDGRRFVDPAAEAAALLTTFTDRAHR